MPNICENYVKITASPETLQLIKATSLDIHELFPAPTSLTAGSDAWWEWIHENWCTKWVSNETRDGPPVVEDRGDHIESHFISAWTFPYTFYQNFVNKYRETRIEYQYSCWESGFIGFGTMSYETIDDQPFHCSYDTPEDLNEAIRVNAGKWKVWCGNPHFDYDVDTGLYSMPPNVMHEEAGGAAAAAAAASSDDETDIQPVPVPKKVVVKKKT